MTKIVVHTRSFHPDGQFGMGGLFFEGDNRGFSDRIGVTSRILHQFTIDLQAEQFTGVICTSDPSENMVPRWTNQGVDAGNAGLERAAEAVGVPGKNGRRVRDLPHIPRMSNDYSQPRKNLSGKISRYRIDGDQSVEVTISYAGKNFAFYGADTNVGHYVLGGRRSDGGSDTGGGSWKIWEDWNGIVPDLDVTHKLSLRIVRNRQFAVIASAISGDGFPNCESFMKDGAQETLFLSTHVRMGTAATQLPAGAPFR